MSTIENLMLQFEQAVNGDAWHGPSLHGLLANVTAKQAFYKPTQGLHNIAEILFHIVAWTEEVAERLKGKEPSLPARGDWPKDSNTLQKKWINLCEELQNAHHSFLSGLAALNADDLDKKIGDIDNAPLGTGYTIRLMVQGLCQHHAYHGGQIVLLKKMATSTEML